MKILLIIILIIFQNTIFLNTIEAKEIDIERSKYVKALKYYKNKNYKKYISIKKELKNYPLYAELEYKELHEKNLLMMIK